MPCIVSFRCGDEFCADSFDSYDLALRFVEFLHMDFMAAEGVDDIAIKVIEAA